MPPAFPGCVIAPLVDAPVPDRPWLCELSAAASLPVGGAEDTGTEAGHGTVSWAEVTTANCRMSMPTAPKTTCLVITFISGLSPLLRTANQAARAFELFGRRYSCVPSTTRLGKCYPPRYRARSSHRKSDEIRNRAARAGFPASGARRVGECRCESCAREQPCESRHGARNSSPIGCDEAYIRSVLFWA